jgi:hypothetical protein
MTAATHADLDRALTLGTNMLASAATGDWATVATLQAECDALIRKDRPTDEATRAALLTLQQQHGELIALAAKAREAVAVELGQHRRNHRAVSAYLVPLDE